jgi:hypothetical protein
MKGLVATYPEQNQWIAFTSDKTFEKLFIPGARLNWAGSVSVSKLTVEDGYTEFFEASITHNDEVLVCYAKITEVEGSDEPIVEFQSMVAKKGEMYMYYVPDKEEKL